MKSFSLKTVAVLCAAASVATIACAAMAQDGPPPPGGPGGPGGQSRKAAAAVVWAILVNGCSSYTNSLQLTPAQEPAFQTWQAALRPAGPAVRPGALRRMSTPQRLDEALNEQSERTSELKARVAATKSFYNQLSATQRQTLDGLPPQELLAMEAMGPGGGGRGGRGGRRGGGGGGFDPNGGFGGPQSFGAPPPGQ